MFPEIANSSQSENNLSIRSSLCELVSCPSSPPQKLSLSLLSSVLPTSSWHLLNSSPVLQILASIPSGIAFKIFLSLISPYFLFNFYSLLIFPFIFSLAFMSHFSLSTGHSLHLLWSPLPSFTPGVSPSSSQVNPLPFTSVLFLTSYIFI